MAKYYRKGVLYRATLKYKNPGDREYTSIGVRNPIQVLFDIDISDRHLIEIAGIGTLDVYCVTEIIKYENSLQVNQSNIYCSIISTH